jgi:hypothetical protein
LRFSSGTPAIVFSKALDSAPRILAIAQRDHAGLVAPSSLLGRVQNFASVGAADAHGAPTIVT